MATLLAITLLGTVIMAFLQSTLVGLNLLATYCFLGSAYGFSTKKDHTDALTSLVYTLASLGAGIAFVLLAHRAGISLPTAHFFYVASLGSASFLYMLKGEKALRLTLIAMCIACFVAGMEINGTLSGSLTWAEGMTETSVKYALAIYLRMVTLPTPPKPPHNKGKKAKHNKLWHWLTPQPTGA